jgi:hypothetical protein
MSDATGFASVTRIDTFPNSEWAKLRFSVKELWGDKTSDYVGGVSSNQYLMGSITQTFLALQEIFQEEGEREN